MLTKALPLAALATLALLSGPAKAALTVNGTSMNGPVLQGINLNGLQLNGPVLNGPVLNGPVLNGPVLNGSVAEAARPAAIGILLPSGEHVTTR